VTSILGIKLTHDAAVALIVDGKLEFSIELEKINNNSRHSAVTSYSEIDDILREEGVDQSSIDAVALDGWKYGRTLKPSRLGLAPYHEGDAPAGELPWGDVLRFHDTSIPLAGELREAVSFTHVAGHLVGSYAMSPWAKEGKPAFAIMWDGGTGARLYLIRPGNGIDFIAHLHFYYGMIYGIMGYYAGPFATDEFRNGPALPIYDNLFGAREWPGKLMSWIALGAVSQSLLTDCWKTNWYIENEMRKRPSYLLNSYQQNGIAEHRFMREVMAKAKRYELKDADVLATVHKFLEDLLVERAIEATPSGHPLIFTGGSALNIKWNSALRSSGHFSEVFVPPCPNDSGSALGAAACYRAVVEREWDLEWNVYAGPKLKSSTIQPGWVARACSVEALARELFYDSACPVVVLNGRAEIGPRALGNRSIIANSDRVGMQQTLNEIKGRENWRPVAPIVAEESAKEFFAPGTRDPYMLFDHMVIRGRDLTEVTHIDGSARLQTVSHGDNDVIWRLLNAFSAFTTVPVLINTSANLNGSGFFPDVESAMRWGKVGKIWSDGILYENNR
jgi:carbamoyltransferase